MNLDEIINKIIEANEAYYKDASPIMSDYDYDSLKNKLKELNPDHPLLSKIGDDSSSGFKKVKHKVKMLSLDNVYELKEEGQKWDEVEKWISKLPEDAEIIVEDKIDGCAVVAEYTNLKLKRVTTRGDGRQGDDITENVKHIFVEKLSDLISSKYDSKTVYVIGEIYMPRDEFLRINKEQEEMELPLYANPRNLCAGTIKAKTKLDRELKFIVHGISHVENGSWTNISHVLEQEGFSTAHRSSCFSKRDIEFIKNALCCCIASRNQKNYEIDGAVIKINSFNQRVELGETSHHPKWAIAVKFLPEQKETVLKDVLWQVSRNGILTPVADLETINLSGASVSRATLHNISYIQQLGIYPGVKVIVERSGEIIPKIMSVSGEGNPTWINELVTGSGVICPSCGCQCNLFRNAKTTYFKCDNASCPGILSQKIFYSFSKGALNVKGIGIKACEQFINSSLVSDYYNVLDLTLDDYPDSFSPLEKSKLYTAIQEARSNSSLERWIVASRCYNIGRSVAEKIGSVCADWREFKTIIDNSPEKLGLSDNQLSAVKSGIKDTAFYLEASGLNPKSESYSENMLLSGLSFVVTGTFNYGRRNLEKYIKNLGGSVKGSVSSKTTYLIVGENIGKNKINAAEKYGTKVISEEEFFELISTL